ncbi:hypothetical protein BV378_18395 [Nostoc sp. RF31YmG]|nr:hypothetical protein BV378_18395 [Nostoc sp. RF31YmG]
MISLGFWNLIILIAVAFILKINWRLDDEKLAWKNSLFLQHPLIKRLVQFLRQPIVKLLLQVVIILVVTRFLLYTGWFIYFLTHNPEPPYRDFRWFYVASQLAHQHLSPFNVETFSGAFCTINDLKKTCGVAPFVYPPNIIPLIWFLGYFSINTAFTIWTLMHVLAIGLLLWGSNILLESRSRCFRTICTIAVVLIDGVVRDMQLANITIFVVVFVLWVFILAQKHQDILAGILLGIAVCKPTLALLFIPYFLLKKRFFLVFVSIATAASLTFIGLFLTGNSLIQFLSDASHAFAIWINDPPNSPYVSVSRFDLQVIGPRLLPNNPLIAKLFSDLIVLILVGLVGLYFYKKQFLTAWSKEIYLPEKVLICCLSLGINYSQYYSSAMLVPVVIFLLNDLLYQIRNCAFSWKRMSIWLSGVGCLAVHTGAIRGLLIFPVVNRFNWGKGELPYILKVTIIALPSYAILGITLSVLVLAITSINQKHNTEFKH